ncbi:MAG TPA: 2-amino-4-hydroxy-6-hydroxymethyldihydropteridine diphosphokinase [Marinilabiliaceae bacterium]|nr:2-amino-4-hydroxy-6-hydroxymethyldihydropteridine diphosphokinase [Marinilabiliaceae bacterium]
MARALVLLGGNEAKTRRLIELAVEKIDLEIGNIVRRSSLYESAPWGFESDSNFLNCVIEVYIENIEPQSLLNKVLGIEKELGRKRQAAGGYLSRPIDIDILFIDNMVIETEKLRLPHPRLHLRRFTLLPLNEYWSDWYHPVLGKTLSELLNECEDRGFVQRLA